MENDLLHRSRAPDQFHGIIIYRGRWVMPPVDENEAPVIQIMETTSHGWIAFGSEESCIDPGSCQCQDPFVSCTPSTPFCHLILKKEKDIVDFVTTWTSKEPFSAFLIIYKTSDVMMAADQQNQKQQQYQPQHQDNVSKELESYMNARVIKNYSLGPGISDAESSNDSNESKSNSWWGSILGFLRQKKVMIGIAIIGALLIAVAIAIYFYKKHTGQDDLLSISHESSNHEMNQGNIEGGTTQGLIQDYK